MKPSGWLCAGLLSVSVFAAAQSPFDGTWRPDAEKPTQPGKPEVSELRQGMYDCQDCKPPYKIPADGQDQAVAGNAYYDTVSVRIVDARTVRMIAKKGGNTVADKTATVSADGTHKTEVQTVTGMTPAPVELTSHFQRVTEGAVGSHRISGGWQLQDMEVSNNAEDTTYRLAGGTLSMTDRMGRSFVAKLDGTEAPYHGDPQYTAVTLKLLEPLTIEESDLKEGRVVKITRWSVNADGKTMHARFDDTQGHIQNQDGHKVP